MIFKIFNSLHKDVDIDSIPSKYEIQRCYGKFGIVRFGEPQIPNDGSPVKTIPPIDWAILPKYDNIFRFGQDVFVLWEKYKVGAVYCAEDAEYVAEWIVPCEYDTVGVNYQDLIFYKPDERVYYFHETHTTRTFNKVDVIGPHGYYIFGVDANSYYIIDSHTDTVLWSYATTDNCLSPWRLFGSEPRFTYLGKTDGLPMFYDDSNCNFIVPNSAKRLDFAPNFPFIICPIIIEGQNIVNIVDDGTQLNAGNCAECLQQSVDDSEGFNGVTVEVKVTLKSENRTEVRCYPVINGTIP